MLLESQRQHSHAASPRPPAYPLPPPSFSPFSSSSTDLRNLSSSSSLSSSLSSSTSFSSSSSSVVSFSGVSASLSLIHPRLGSNPMPSFGVPESIVARRIERSFLLPWVRGAVLVLRHSLQLTGEMQSLYPLADMIFACLLDRRRRRPHGYSLLEALPHGVILEALQSLCLLRYHRRRASDFDLLLECLAGLPSPLLALDKGGALALWTAYDILRYEGGASISWRMGSIPTRRGRNPLADAVKIQPSDLHKLFVSFKRDCQDIALDVSAHFKRYGVQHCLWPHERTTGGLPLAIQLFLPSPPSHASRFEGGGGEGRHRSFPSLSFSSSFDARTCNSSSAFQDCISHEKETPLPGVPVPYSTSPKKTNKKVREEECLSQERPHLHTSRQNRNFPSQLSCVAREPSYSSFSSSTLQHPPLRSSLSSSSTVSLSSQPSLARDASVASSSRDDRQGSGDTRCGLLILPQEVISRRHLDGRPFLLLRSFVYHACKQATASSSFRGGVQEVNTDVRRRRRQQEEDSPSPSSSSSSLLHVTYGYGDIIGGLERRGWEKILILIEGEWRDACKANERDQLLLRLLMEAGVDVSSSSSLLQQPGFNERQADTSSYSPQPKLAFSSRCLYTHQGGSVDGPRRHNPPSHHLHL